MQKVWAQKQTGFTIVELLIVVVVIAILAAITTVAYSGIRAKAEQSARVSEMNQLHKKIQTSSVQADGVSVDLAAPLVYTKTGSDTAFSSPLKKSQEVTMYVVFDTNGVLGTDYIEVVRLLPNAADNNMYLRTSTSSYMGARLDTSASVNVTSTLINPIRNTTGRHIGWITTKSNAFYSNYDSHAEMAYALSPHSGWNFNAIRLNVASKGGVAAVVFPEYHNELQRQVIMRWLDREHTIDFY